VKKLILGALMLAYAAIASAQNYSCQLDGSAMYFTGQTRIDFGHLLYEYKCPMGHTAWIAQ
jgi:hypothetical protein